MNHPLKVYNPSAGVHFLLQWWTHNEQNRVIVARSENSLHSAFKHVCEENHDCRINQILEVEFVAPSNDMCQKASESKRREDIHLFLQSVTLELQNCFKLNQPLPTQFQCCTTYSPSPDYISEGESPTEFAIEGHYECLNCYNGVTLVGHTPESLYDRYHEAWDRSDPTKRRRAEDTLAKYSSARQARDDEEIWVAYPDFGYHSRGVAFSVIGVYPTNTVLFYFRLVRELDRIPWEAQIFEAQKKRAEKKRMDDKAWETKRQAIEAAKISRMLKVFTEEKS